MVNRVRALARTVGILDIYITWYLFGIHTDSVLFL